MKRFWMEPFIHEVEVVKTIIFEKEMPVKIS